MYSLTLQPHEQTSTHAIPHVLITLDESSCGCMRAVYHTEKVAQALHHQGSKQHNPFKKIHKPTKTAVNELRNSLRPNPERKLHHMTHTRWVHGSSWGKELPPPGGPTITRSWEIKSVNAGHMARDMALRILDGAEGASKGWGAQVIWERRARLCCSPHWGVLVCQWWGLRFLLYASPGIVRWYLQLTPKTRPMRVVGWTFSYGRQRWVQNPTFMQGIKASTHTTHAWVASHTEPLDTHKSRRRSCQPS